MSDEAIFAMYFATVAGWQFHPGSGHGEAKILSLAQAADHARDMVAIHRIHFPKEVCDGNR